MKKAWVLLLIFFSACAPSPQAIQTAIAKTQAAWTPTTTHTYTPAPTTTQTYTPAPTTIATSILIPPTLIPIPGTTYIVEEGFCVMDVGNITGNPTGQAGCGLTKRIQMQIGPNQEITVTLSNNTGEEEVYCSLYSLDGTYIMSDLDTTGSEKAICSPK